MKSKRNSSWIAHGAAIVCVVLNLLVETACATVGDDDIVPISVHISEQFPAVGILTYETDSGVVVGWCSATVVSSSGRILLTAAHCVSETGDYQFVFYGGVSVIGFENLTVDERLKHAKVASNVTRILASGRDESGSEAGEFASNDWALLELESPIPQYIPVADLQLRNYRQLSQPKLNAFSVIHSLSYPCSNRGVLGGELFRSANWYHQLIPDNGGAGRERIGYYGCFGGDLTNGSSGSAVLGWKEGNWSVYGVVSTAQVRHREVSNDTIKFAAATEFAYLVEELSSQYHSTASRPSLTPFDLQTRDSLIDRALREVKMVSGLAQNCKNELNAQLTIAAMVAKGSIPGSQIPDGERRAVSNIKKIADGCSREQAELLFSILRPFDSQFDASPQITSLRAYGEKTICEVNLLEYSAEELARAGLHELIEANKKLETAIRAFKPAVEFERNCRGPDCAETVNEYVADLNDQIDFSEELFARKVSFCRMALELSESVTRSKTWAELVNETNRRLELARILQNLGK